MELLLSDLLPDIHEASTVVLDASRRIVTHDG